MAQQAQPNGNGHGASMVVRQGGSGGLEPATMAELQQLAKHAADTHFFGAESPAQALLIMMTGKDLGLSFTQSLRMFHVIEGKMSLSADAAVALCVGRSDVCEHFRCVDQTDTKSTWETKRVGGRARTFTFSVEDAKLAGLVKQTKNGQPGMWQKYPGRMCSARAKMFLARDEYPEILAGLLDVDEARDIAAEKRAQRDVPAARPSPSPVPHDADGVVVEAETEPQPKTLTEVLAWIETAPREAASESDETPLLSSIAAWVKANGNHYSRAEMNAFRAAYTARVESGK